MIKEYPLLISAVREQLMGELPRVIVLDTLNKSLVGSESKDVDMAAYIVAAEALRDAFDCVVIIIHHCGYDETHPRGHTSLTGAVDAEFEVVREGMLVTIKNVTMRDGPEGFEIRRHAEVVEVGEDVNGKVLTSLVIVPTDAPAAVGEKEERGRPSVATPILVDALRAALAEHGGIFRPPGDRAAVHAVSESEVRARFEDGYPAGEVDKAKAVDTTGKPTSAPCTPPSPKTPSVRASARVSTCFGSKFCRGENGHGNAAQTTGRNSDEIGRNAIWSPGRNARRNTPL